MLFENIPKKVCVWVDTGFKGVEKVHPNTQIPTKRSRGSPLTEKQKEENHLISSIRVLSEHAICGIKRMASVSTIARNHIPLMDDSLIVIAAGLWNYHLQSS